MWNRLQIVQQLDSYYESCVDLFEELVERNPLVDKGIGTLLTMTCILTLAIA